MTHRPEWDEYFMGIAKHAASRATCNRKQVGAVLVRDRRILATGYNGSMRGHPHCDDAGHLMEDGHCVRTIHAEVNAVVAAAAVGTPTQEADCYVTASPCWNCFKLLGNAGIRRIVYGEQYRLDKNVINHARAHSWEGMGVLLL